MTAVFTAILAGVENRSFADVVLFNNLNNTTNGFRQISPTSWSAQLFNSDVGNQQLTSATLTLDTFGNPSTNYWLPIALYINELCQFFLGKQPTRMKP